MKVRQYYFRIYYSNASGIIRVYHSFRYESPQARNRALSASLRAMCELSRDVCEIVKLSECVEL